MTVDALRELRDGFHALPDDLPSDAGHMAGYRAKLEDYYQQQFAKHYQAQTGQAVDAKALLPRSPASLLAQYLYIADNERPLGTKDELMAHADGSRYSRAHARFHPRLRSFLKRFGYYDIFLIDARTGDVVYTTFKELDFSTNLASGPYKGTALGRAYRSALAASADQSRLEDFAPYLPSYDGAASFIGAPIYDGDEKVGVLVFQMPVGEINALMAQRAGLGESGETYLVGSDQLMRSQSRFSEENTLLSRKIDTAAVAAAFAAGAGQQRMPDYRGVDVLSSYTPLQIEGVKWALLAEIDSEEALGGRRHATPCDLDLGHHRGRADCGLRPAAGQRYRTPCTRRRGDCRQHCPRQSREQHNGRWPRRGRRTARRAGTHAERVVRADHGGEGRSATLEQGGERAKGTGAARRRGSRPPERRGRTAGRLGTKGKGRGGAPQPGAGKRRHRHHAARPGRHGVLCQSAHAHARRAAPTGAGAQGRPGRFCGPVRQCACELKRLVSSQQHAEVEVRFERSVFGVSSNPVNNLEGRHAGYVLEWTDLSEQRQAEDAIKQLLTAANAGLLDRPHRGARLQRLHRLDG
jgi:hypothetical protein